MTAKPSTSPSPEGGKQPKAIDDARKSKAQDEGLSDHQASRIDLKKGDDMTEAERSKIKKQQIAELQQRQVGGYNQNKEVLDVLTEEQKRDRERAKQLEKVSDPVEREKLELKFDTERAKIKQKMKNMVKRHAEEISKLESSI